MPEPTNYRQELLARLRQATEDFAWATRELCRLAAAQCGGRVVSTLEGGYDLEGLAGSVHACVDVMAGASAPGGSDVPSPAGEPALRKAVEQHRRFWPQ